MEPIIPGLPDDLSLRCLAKISHGYHGSLETVSKRWRHVLRSTEYSSCKAREGWSGDWVFLLTENSNDQWIAYDPDADRWHPIPMIPRENEYAWSGGFGCVCVGKRFLVIGGSYCETDPRETDERPFMTNKVFQFDTFTKEWSEATSMKTPRAYFGCCVMSGKVYVCGGSNMFNGGGILALAEVYDPLTNKWEELPQMCRSQMDSVSLSHNGNLYVFSHLQGKRLNRNCTQFRKYRTEIFDPSKQVWTRKQMNWPCSRKDGTYAQVTQDGRMYTAYVDGGEIVMRAMDNGGELHADVVAKVPYFVGASTVHLPGVGEYGFAALGNELCVLGGKMMCFVVRDLIPEIKYLNLDRCWIWDGKLRETRRMCRPSRGAAIGFAALKENNM